MKLKSKKDPLFSIIILGVNAFLIGLLIWSFVTDEFQKSEIWIAVLIVGVVALLFLLYFGTHYELTKEKGLSYRSGPFFGTIEVDRINEIINGKTLWVGFRPATSRKGLIIKYDAYNEIYISPKNKQSFLDHLIEMNPNIKITEH